MRINFNLPRVEEIEISGLLFCYPLITWQSSCELFKRNNKRPAIIHAMNIP